MHHSFPTVTINSISKLMFLSLKQHYRLFAQKIELFWLKYPNFIVYFDENKKKSKKHLIFVIICDIILSTNNY